VSKNQAWKGGEEEEDNFLCSSTRQICVHPALLLSSTFLSSVSGPLSHLLLSSTFLSSVSGPLSRLGFDASFTCYLKLTFRLPQWMRPAGGLWDHADKLLISYTEAHLHSKNVQTALAPVCAAGTDAVLCSFFVLFLCCAHAALKMDCTRSPPLSSLTQAREERPISLTHFSSLASLPHLSLLLY
jgi:hypothetical protein